MEFPTRMRSVSGWVFGLDVIRRTEAGEIPLGRPSPHSALLYACLEKARPAVLYNLLTNLEHRLARLPWEIAHLYGISYADWFGKWMGFRAGCY